MRKSAENCGKLFEAFAY